MSRYARQISLADVGTNGQTQLEKAHILVVGAGGLGSAALPYLVGAGLGRLTLVDGDKVSLSNLHRQVLYKEADVNKAKVECALGHLHGINKHAVIETHNFHLTPKNVAQLCDGVDVVLDCADNFAVSYTLSDYCLSNSIPLVSASALGFTGYIGGFCHQSPSLRAVFPELPEHAPNCSSAGVMGPVVGTLGCMQAQFALNILLKLQPSPLGQLLNIDLRNLTQTSFRFDDAPEPNIDDALRFIDASDINQEDWVVDLRTHSNRISAKSIDTKPKVHYATLDDFAQHKLSPKTKQHAIIACKTGLTAWRAARMLQQYWQGNISLVAMGEAPLKGPKH